MKGLGFLKIRLFSHSMAWLVVPLFAGTTAAGLLWVRRCPPKTVFKVRRDLAALTIVSHQNVDEVSTFAPPPRALVRAGDVYDRLVVAAMHRGAIILDSDVVSVPQGAPEITGWRLFTARLVATARPLPGERLTLIGFKEGGGEAPILVSRDGIALASDGNQVTVALPPDAEKDVLPFLVPQRGLLAIRSL